MRLVAAVNCGHLSFPFLTTTTTTTICIYSFHIYLPPALFGSLAHTVQGFPRRSLRCLWCCKMSALPLCPTGRIVAAPTLRARVGLHSILFCPHSSIHTSSTQNVNGRLRQKPCRAPKRTSTDRPFYSNDISRSTASDQGRPPLREQARQRKLTRQVLHGSVPGSGKEGYEPVIAGTRTPGPSTFKNGRNVGRPGLPPETVRKMKATERRSEREKAREVLSAEQWHAGVPHDQVLGSQEEVSPGDFVEIRK